MSYRLIEDVSFFDNVQLLSEIFGIYCEIDFQIYYDTKLHINDGRVSKNDGKIFSKLKLCLNYTVNI